MVWGFPGGSLVKNQPANEGNARHRFYPWVEKILWKRKWQLTPVILPEKYCRVTVHGVIKSQTWLSMHAQWFVYSVQFSSVAQSCPTLCDPMDCSMSGFPVHHQLPELTQTHVHQVGDATQPSHPLSSPSPAFNLPQHQGLFQWVTSYHQVAKVLEFQLHHQSFQWIFRTDFL